MKGLVSFYEKPGCKGNERQKKLLIEAGYALHVIDLLSKDWKTEDLLKFFSGRSIYDCVNTRAPKITKEGFDPSKLSEDELLMEMINNPILIKRPLLFYRGEFGVGFDNDLVDKLLGDLQRPSECQKREVCS